MPAGRSVCCRLAIASEQSIITTRALESRLERRRASKLRAVWSSSQLIYNETSVFRRATAIHYVIMIGFSLYTNRGAETIASPLNTRCVVNDVGGFCSYLSIITVRIITIIALLRRACCFIARDSDKSACELYTRLILRHDNLLPGSRS